jgi:acetyl esterase/lipase
MPMKNYRQILLLSLVLSTSGISAQEETLPLWPNGIPNSRESTEKEISEKGEIHWIRNVQEPTISVFLPTRQHATGQAVVICPGGGYGGLAYDWEGIDIAKWLNSKGIAAMVLKYRLPNSASVEVSYKAPLQDVQRAMRLVRANAEKWNIDQNKVGVLGFSAGGHLASTLGTHFDHEDSFKKDSVDAFSARPNFMALVYPVITMDAEFTHQGSRNSLLGENPSEELVKEFSSELQVKTNTPPTFIIHATDDDAVPVENALLFYKALKEKDIYTEMHIYPEGGHGFSLGLGKGYLETWPGRLYDWLQRLDDKP